MSHFSYLEHYILILMHIFILHFMQFQISYYFPKLKLFIYTIFTIFYIQQTGTIIKHFTNQNFMCKIYKYFTFQNGNYIFTYQHIYYFGLLRYFQPKLYVWQPFSEPKFTNCANYLDIPVITLTSKSYIVIKWWKYSYE